ncbi:MAG: DUF4258 domain-containing protein [Bacillota bacterium]
MIPAFAYVENAIHTGEIIEPYPNDPRGPSCLVYVLNGYLASRQIVSNHLFNPYRSQAF